MTYHTYNNKLISAIAIMGIALITITLGIAVSFLTAIPVMLIWNWLFVKLAIFGTPFAKITLIQAWCLNILFSLWFRTEVKYKNKD